MTRKQLKLRWEQTSVVHRSADHVLFQMFHNQKVLLPDDDDYALVADAAAAAVVAVDELTSQDAALNSH